MAIGSKSAPCERCIRLKAEVKQLRKLLREIKKEPLAAMKIDQVLKDKP